MCKGDIKKMADRLPLHLCNSIKQYCGYSKIGIKVISKLLNTRLNFRLVLLFVLLLSESRFCTGFSGRNSMLRTRVIGTRYGKLQGVILPMDQHKYLKPVEAYLGVPYATPPTGSNR